MDAPSFTYFRTVDETQSLMKKVQESEWPKNGWTGSNSAMHREQPEKALGAPSDARDRAYVGDWTSCERERQYVQAKLCTPPRGLPHAEGCNVKMCRGECLTVPDYHLPLPGGTGGPRSLQSQQERDLSGAPVYIPGTPTQPVSSQHLSRRSSQEYGSLLVVPRPVFDRLLVIAMQGFSVAGAVKSAARPLSRASKILSPGRALRVVEPRQRVRRPQYQLVPGSAPR